MTTATATKPANLKATLTAKLAEKHSPLTHRPRIEGLPLVGNYLDWVNEIGIVLWEEVNEIPAFINPILEMKLDKHLICEPPTGQGWWKRSGDNRSWMKCAPSDLPDAMVIDVESREIEKGIDRWEPTLAVAVAPSGWFVWQGDGGLIPISQGKIFITQNGSEHDSRFFSSEFLAPSKDRNGYIDTRGMVEAFKGILPSQYATFEKIQGNAKAGKGTPEWVNKATRSNLHDAAESILGIRIHKTTQGGLFDGVQAPKSYFEYCCQDVWATLLLFQKLYPMMRGLTPSGAWHWGQFATTGLRVNVGKWELAKSTLRDCYNDAKDTKKADRTESQENLIQWGKSYLSRFENAVINDGVMPLRINPCNVFGGFSGDWLHWTSPGNEIGVWGTLWDFDNNSAIGAFPLIDMANDYGQPLDSAAEVFEYPSKDTGSQTKQLVFTLPSPKKLGPTSAGMLAGRPVVKSRFLGMACPQSIIGEKFKAEWIANADRCEVFYMFATVMDAFIEEYELDAWLSVPGENYALYAVNDGEGSNHAAILKACGEEAIRIIDTIIKQV